MPNSANRSDVTSDGVRNRATEAPIPRCEDFTRMPQMAPVEIGPESVEKDKLGISRLPQQEIGKPLLAGRADPQVDIRDIRLVEVTVEKLLVDLVRAEPPGRHVAGDRGGRVEYLRPAAVVAAELQRENGVLLAQLLRVLQLADDGAPQPRPSP